MGFLGIVKDIIVLPLEATLDLTGVSAVMSIVQGKEIQVRTFDSLKSFGENLDETLRKEESKSK